MICSVHSYFKSSFFTNERMQYFVRKNFVKAIEPLFPWEMTVSNGYRFCLMSRKVMGSIPVSEKTLRKEFYHMVSSQIPKMTHVPNTQLSKTFFFLNQNHSNFFKGSFYDWRSLPLIDVKISILTFEITTVRNLRQNGTILDFNYSDMSFLTISWSISTKYAII